MCAHAVGHVIHSCAHSRASLHDPRRVTRRRTAALQPRAADRAHPAHRTRDRPFYADDSIVERLQANRARAGASQHLQLRKTTHHSTKMQKEYLVLWKHYSIDDASWTPADHFTYPEELKKMEDRDQPAEDN